MSAAMEAVCAAAGWPYCAEHDRAYRIGGCYHLHRTDCATCGGSGLVEPTPEWNAGGPGWAACPDCDGPKGPSIAPTKPVRFGSPASLPRTSQVER